MRKDLQHALTHESSVCQDQLQQTLRRHACQEEYADAVARQEAEQQAEAMKRLESQSQQFVTQQQEEWTHKQRALFQQFDGVIRDKDEVFQSLKQELANNQERRLQSWTRLSRMQNAEHSKAHQCSQGLQPNLWRRRR